MMPDYEIIAAVSQTLESFLTDALSGLQPTPPPVAQVHDLQDPVRTNPATLTIFLFEVGEDPGARNRPIARGVIPPEGTLQKPPMALLLRYMLTPYSGDPLIDHKILGRVLQVLHNDPILCGSLLQGVLKDTDQALKITLSQLSLEEQTRLWHSVQKPYKLSVYYEVRLINLEASSR
jgi:hypothetical protein